MNLSRRQLFTGLAAMLLAPPDLLSRRVWALGALPVERFHPSGSFVAMGDGATAKWLWVPIGGEPVRLRRLSDWL